LTIFGFRSSSKSILIGMLAGLITSILCNLVFFDLLPAPQNIIGLLLAMICNAVFLIASHYLLRQPGGWVGIKDTAYLDEQKIRRQQQRDGFIQWVKNFNIRTLCQKIAPPSEVTYTMLGIYFVICTITTMYSTQVELLGANAQLMKIIYPSMLLTGTTMAMYQIWPLSIADSIKKAIIETWYPIAIFYMLILFSCFFVIVSKFAMLQVALFIINLMIASLLLGWRLALPSIIIGFYSAIQFYQYFFGKADFAVQFGSPEFILIYAVLFLGSAVIVFLKPKEERQEASDIKVGTLETEVIHLDDEVIHLTTEVTDLNEKVDHYSERVSDQNKEIERFGATVHKILNNVNH